MRIIYGLFCLIFLVSSPIYASVCERVIVTGYQNWPPYSFMKDDVLIGVGVDIVSQIFQELDIPVEVQTFEKPSKMSLMLQQGQIDLLIGTYDMPEWKDSVHLIEPAYFEDAIGILVPADKSFPFERWYDLMGRTGVAVNQTQLGARFTDFAGRYLAIDYQPTVEAALDILQKHEAEYLVGSVTSVRSTLVKLVKQDNFKFLPNLAAPEKVYLAFSKDSGCKEYLPFIQTSLKNMQQQGSIEGLFLRYSN